MVKFVLVKRSNGRTKYKFVFFSFLFTGDSCIQTSIEREWEKSSPRYSIYNSVHRSKVVVICATPHFFQFVLIYRGSKIASLVACHLFSHHLLRIPSYLLVLKDFFPFLLLSYYFFLFFQFWILIRYTSRNINFFASNLPLLTIHHRQ